MYSQRGYFAIGIENAKTSMNVGTLWRSAYIYDAHFIFTIGRRIPQQASDTVKSWRHIPYFRFDTFDQFYELMPYDCQLIGIEIDSKARPLGNFIHPHKCIYLLGAEDGGLSKKALEKSHQLVQLPGKYCLNVAVAGSIVMYDRINKSDNK
jgi:tRNA G18 (ribose-2'-O)-methylase SpoU